MTGASYECDLQAIIEHIRKGEDLKRFLSADVRRVFKPNSEKRPHARREDRDRLLADWQVHHLHVSNEIENNGFVKRTGPVLLGIFLARDAYLIDVGQHSQWANLEIMRIVLHNWPDIGVLRASRFAEGSNTALTDDERQELRDAGVAMPLEIDGKLYAPRWQSIDGVPMDVAQHVMGLMQELDDFQNRFNEDENWLQSPAGSSAAWVPLVQDDEFGFYDLTARHFVVSGLRLSKW